jgi:hypothetical protein
MIDGGDWPDNPLAPKGAIFDYSTLLIIQLTRGVRGSVFLRPVECDFLVESKRDSRSSLGEVVFSLAREEGTVYLRR